MIRTRPKPQPDDMPISKMRSRAAPSAVECDAAPEHLAFVARHRCCVPGCGAHPVHVHHRLSAKRGMGTKAIPAECVPLCPPHHLAHWSTGVHAWGNEAKWEAAFGVDLAKVARALAAESVRRGWLEHAYEEALDTATYLKRVMVEIDGARGGAGEH